jgi:hypothetical protein
MDMLTFFGVPLMVQTYIHVAVGVLLMFGIVAWLIVMAFPNAPAVRGSRKARTSAALLVLLLALMTMPTSNGG